MKLFKIKIAFCLVFCLNIFIAARSNHFQLTANFYSVNPCMIRTCSKIDLLMSITNLPSLNIVKLTDQENEKKIINRYLLFQRISWVGYGIMIAGDVALLTGVILLFFVPYQYLGGSIPFFSLTLSLIIGGSVISIVGLILALVFSYKTKLTFSKPDIFPTNTNENVIKNRILDFKIPF